MGIRIVEADLNDMLGKRRAGRIRSPEMQAMLDSISRLRPGKARAILPDEGETIPAMRSRLAYAARVAGVKLRIATTHDRIMFTLRRDPPVRSVSRENATARRDSVQRAALRVGRSRKTPFTAENLLGAMARNGVKFDMPRPATMVGAILRSMPAFERVGKNRFKYTG